MPESANNLSQSMSSTWGMAGEALAFAFGFLARNPGAVLRCIAVPSLMGCVVLYVLVWSYCVQLTDYLGSPSEGLAGRVMGIAAASVLIMLLLHSVVISRLAELVLGGKGGAPGFLGVRPDTWRIYAANLRLLLGLGLYGLSMFGVSTLMGHFGIPADIIKAFDVVAWILLFWLMARYWFFLVPISLQMMGEGRLDICWRKSEGHLPTIAAVVLPILVFILCLLAVGEFLLRTAGVFSLVPANLTFVKVIGLYQRNLWPFVIMVSVVYILGVTLITAARVRLYQRLEAVATT